MIAASMRSLPSRLAIGSLSRNGLFVLGQSLVVLACVFLGYRLVIAQVGLERFGIWSLLLAGSAIARIGDVSGGGALARFVAATTQGGDQRRSCYIVHTVILTSLALNSAIGLALWIAAPALLPLFVAPSHLLEAYALMPYVVASMVLGALAVAITSGIDGAQRADRRALVVVAGALVFLAACATLVPSHGVVGFGAAQVLQQITIVIIGWLVLRRHVADLGWFPWLWRRDAFVETTGYAVKLNIIALTTLMFEPLAKFTFNHAGGPGLVALYELASRLVVQMRGLVASAAAPLIPAFAAQSGAADPAFRQMLEKAMKVAVPAGVGTAFVTLVCAPIMSLVVLGRISTDLLTMNAALTAGWSINILAIPFYFAAQGIGILRWNFMSQVVIALSVFVGAFLLVPMFGSIGLVAAIVAGLTLSALIILIGNAYEFNALLLVKSWSTSVFGGGLAIIALCAGAFMLAIVA